MGRECGDDGWARGGKPTRLLEVVYGAAGLHGRELHRQVGCYLVAMDCAGKGAVRKWKQASEG